MTGAREVIVETYAQWTTLSALRSCAPVKSRRDVYSAIRHVKFGVLFDCDAGPIERDEFDGWHEAATKCLLAAEQRLSVGWATKILNVYLKTRCYIASEGRDGLRDAIHPPIDRGLWLGLERQFGDRPDILQETNCVRRIKDIDNYTCYRQIIRGCQAAALALNCRLIEIEQLWLGTEYGEPLSARESNG
jgi:hypothetical protein